MEPITILYEKDFNAPKKERKHIILMDGTWNDETGIGGDMLVTNIVQMSRIFQNDEENQIVRYHRGVGNDNDNNSFKSKWKGATGRAIKAIIDRAYARFVQDWQYGDHIYIFGFSRGAAAARMLAKKIEEEKIPAKVEITLEPKQNRETRVVEQRITKVEFDRSDCRPAEIEFLGVWDTVTALGLTNNFLRFIGLKEADLFTNHDISAIIKKAVHLVAIDETRKPFVPSLMNHKENVTHEVWFPGVHSDIGGSYLEDDIAQASLYYMIQCMEEWNTERGLPEFKVDESAKSKYTKAKIDKAHFHFHGKAFGKDVRHIKVQVDGEPSDLVPMIHHLYYDIVSQKNSYSVFQLKKFLRKAVKYVVNFQYMPFNVKALKEFKIVK